MANRLHFLKRGYHDNPGVRCYSLMLDPLPRTHTISLQALPLGLVCHLNVFLWQVLLKAWKFLHYLFSKYKCILDLCSTLFFSCSPLSSRAINLCCVKYFMLCGRFLDTTFSFEQIKFFIRFHSVLESEYRCICEI